MKKIRRFLKLRYLLLAAILWFLLRGTLNYTGFCWAEKRWLSDEERIDIAIEKIISADKAWIWDGINGSKTYKVIQYKSIEDFKTKNPDCCNIEYLYNLTSYPLINHILGNVSIWYPVIKGVYYYEYKSNIYTTTQDMARGYDGWPWLATDNCGNHIELNDY